MSIADILRGYKKETKTAYENGTFYLLIDIQQKNGEKLLGKIMSVY